jgi:hypothetical protein
MKKNHVPENPFGATKDSPKSNGSDDHPYFRKVIVTPNESAFIEIKD